MNSYDINRVKGTLRPRKIETRKVYDDPKNQLFSKAMESRKATIEGALLNAEEKAKRQLLINEGAGDSSWEEAEGLK